MDNSKKIATLRDVAQKLGLSVTAVSRTLNHKDCVSKETAEKIFEAAKQLNYSPNIVAKSLRLNETKTIGVIVSDSSQSFIAKVIKGIEFEASRKGYNIILCNTDRDYDKERKAISLLVSKRIDGLIFAASLLESEADVQFVRRFGIPFVYLIRKANVDNIDYVINDNFLGSYIMVDYLVKKGNTRIHFLNLPKDNQSGKDRVDGYRKALKDNSITYDPSLIKYIQQSEECGYQATSKLLDLDRPQSIFCGTDIIAIGAMQAILDRGLNIPEDIQVVGYDDIEFAQYLRVPLTTVRQPQYQMGSMSVQVLLDRIKNPEAAPQHIILKPELIIRHSA